MIYMRSLNTEIQVNDADEDPVITQKTVAFSGDEKMNDESVGFAELNASGSSDGSSLVDSGVMLDAMKSSNNQNKILKRFPPLVDQLVVNNPPNSIDTNIFNANMLEIYNKVFKTSNYNYKIARIPIPSGLHMNMWRSFLDEYQDKEILEFLEYGWPSNFTHSSSLQSTFKNHSSAREFSSHIDAYLKVEADKFAILGPFTVPPVTPIHLSPLMTRPKKDSDLRRVVVDLSWPRGMSLNDGIPMYEYLGKPVSLTLPTVDYMAARVQELGEGCFMYKLDLSRGYRQLRLDPLDWPLTAIKHKNSMYMDICPPFGLRTAALMMERTTLAVSYIHGLYGFLTKPYIDDFGGAESKIDKASEGLCTLQRIVKTVGLEEASKKTCYPSTRMTWLGIDVDSTLMNLSIPPEKLKEVQVTVSEWCSREVATRNQVQSLMGLLNFVSSVSPPVRVYTNRILTFLRSMPKEGYMVVTDEVKEDLRFFELLMPHFNGVTLIDRSMVPPSEYLEIDACLTGCGGMCGSYYYSREFPSPVLQENHQIAHLEMLNTMVAVRLWAPVWSGCKLQVFCDNMNTCVALQTGRSRDKFMQSCVRTIFLLSVIYDIELLVCHRPGVSMVAADALSRYHTADRFRGILEQLGCLGERERIDVPDSYFELHD